MDTVPVFKL